ncbi:MAG: hypothetical protein A2945_00275 [Candidatus Liptonbacteria bacterium RIFCSPLOWO2_01_FULL_52_25]|uniref:Uncharacterized protein n=1 Tax=Candidatus Liptonbacteria bacterium RIFCSPLOWO2_01_FULL_52_25 TaxID=1798650 RepID=A0A1G2CFF2_9BACT|nr:MAG: hypothetical protein A2945_00275 [Candidatus Liptonbacteria bacterium RIFCSPLOWO2_01_FULL_52_25]
MLEIHKDVNVVLGPGFLWGNTTPESREFYDRCIEVARWWNRIMEGGISIKLWNPHTERERPFVSFWWKDREVIGFYLNHDSTNFSRTVYNTDRVVTEGASDGRNKELPALGSHISERRIPTPPR